jgi:hypothetical protein
MRWLVRTRLLLWIAGLATVPAAILDLADATWPILAVPAGIFGFPYYAAQSAIGMDRAGSRASLMEVLLSAALAAVPFVLAHYLLARRVVVTERRGAPAA